mgnify:CR=1 FL=1
MAAGCVSLESEELLEELQDAVEERGLGDSVAVKGSGCMGLCARGPLVQVQPAGLLYGEVSPRDADDIVDSLGDSPVDRLRVPQQEAFYSNQKRIVLLLGRRRVQLLIREMLNMQPQNREIVKDVLAISGRVPEDYIERMMQALEDEPRPVPLEAIRPWVIGGDGITGLEEEEKSRRVDIPSAVIEDASSDVD